MIKHHSLLAGAFFLLSGLSLPAQGTLQVILMAGQSNMEGHANTYGDYNSGAPALEFLAETSDYVSILPPAIYTCKEDIVLGWLLPRTDVWAVHFDSVGGTMLQVEPTSADDPPGSWSTAVLPLGPGFGFSNSRSTFGPELGMGIYLADRIADPLLIVKSDHGGRTLAVNFRPPSAVAARGGVTGPDYLDSVASFQWILDDLDADLADNNVLDAYGNAMAYEVAAFGWLQGFNDGLDAAKRAEYEDNLVDFINDIRASDPRIPNDLPFIIPESSDASDELNTARQNAVATINAANPNSAVFFGTREMKNLDWSAQGYPFSTGAGFHFNNRAENYLEIGWRMGGSRRPRSGSTCPVPPASRSTRPPSRPTSIPTLTR